MKIAPKEYWGKIGKVEQYGDFGYIIFYEVINNQGIRESTLTEYEYSKKYPDRKPDYVRSKCMI